MFTHGHMNCNLSSIVPVPLKLEYRHRKHYTKDIPKERAETDNKKLPFSL